MKPPNKPSEKDRERARLLRIEINKLPDHHELGADGDLYHALNPAAELWLAQAFADVRAEGDRKSTTVLTPTTATTVPRPSA